MPEVHLQSHKFEHQEVFLPFKQGDCSRFYVCVYIHTHTHTHSIPLYPAFLFCDLATPSSRTLAADGKSKIGKLI